MVLELMISSQAMLQVTVLLVEKVCQDSRLTLSGLEYLRLNTRVNSLSLQAIKAI